MLTKVCSWCGKKLGTIPSDHDGITHCMCTECEKEVMAEEMEELINDIIA